MSDTASNDGELRALPAPETKHLATLTTPLPSGRSVRLTQSNTTTSTTGTTLYLGAQVLAAYLAASLSKKGRGAALESGAGVGYLALTLADMGYTVRATDIEPVLSEVLRPNLEESGVDVCELDWLSPDETVLGERYDLVVTTDTIYERALVPSLWACLEKACSKRTAVYVALERRDPALVDMAMEIGRSRGWVLNQVVHENVAKAVEKAGWDWSEEDWEGVEVWRGRWAAAKK